MSETDTSGGVKQIGGSDARLSLVVGELEGEPVLALLIRIPDGWGTPVAADSNIEGIWNWVYPSQETAASLAFQVEISREDQPILSDQFIFQIGQDESMAMLKCLMRQSCLPVLFLDHRSVELLRVGFAWGAEDRSEVASLTGIALACSYHPRSLAPGGRLTAAP